MLKLVSFNSFNLYKNLSYPPLKSYKKNSNFVSPLAPLKQDTLSFSGAKNLNRGLMESIDNKELCATISQDANVANSYLSKLLKDTFKSNIVSKDHPNGIIQKISTRVKTPDSIREKVTSILELALLDNFSLIFQPNSEKGIKKALGDIVGAKIVIANSQQKYTSKIINGLIKQIEAEKLVVTNIENYSPPGLDSKYQYFSREDLERLQKAANEHRKPGSPEVELNFKEVKSGYMALHVDLDLSNPDYKVKNNGYKGEIQILGYDVAKLKEIEDFCYKISQEKTIRGANPAYKPFVDYFKYYMNNNEEYPNLKEDFLAYTAKAYEIQRKKKPCVDYSQSKRKRVTLPSIKQCQMEGKIPPELDFNELANIKYHCDEIYKKMPKNMRVAS